MKAPVPPAGPDYPQDQPDAVRRATSEGYADGYADGYQDAWLAITEWTGRMAEAAKALNRRAGQ